jgi:hypothetical protein
MKKQTNNAVQDNVEMETLKESEARFRRRRKSCANLHC